MNLFRTSSSLKNTSSLLKFLQVYCGRNMSINSKINLKTLIVCYVGLNIFRNLLVVDNYCYVCVMSMSYIIFVCYDYFVICICILICISTTI